MIVETQTMNGPFLRRRRARKAARRAEAKEIEAATTRMLETHLEDYSTGGPIVGAGVRTGTYQDDSVLEGKQLDAEAALAADQQKTIRTVGVLVIVGVLVLVLKKKPQTVEVKK